jgi:AcrR family transcriptional regulator
MPFSYIYDRTYNIQLMKRVNEKIRPNVYNFSMSPKPASEDGRRRRGAASREMAMVGAIRIAETEGLEALSFGRVAAEAGMAKSSLQVLFADREQLQLHTLAASISAFGARVAQRVEQSSIDSKRPLWRLCDAWFDVVSSPDCRGGCLLTAAMSEYRGRHGAIPDALQQGQQWWAAALRRAAEAGIQTGELSPSADIDQLVFELQAFQGAANIAASTGDDRALSFARQAVRNRIQRVAGAA